MTESSLPVAAPDCCCCCCFDSLLSWVESVLLSPKLALPRLGILADCLPTAWASSAPVSGRASRAVAYSWGSWSLASWALARPVDVAAGRVAGGLAGWVAGWVAGRLVARVAGRVAGQLVGRVAG